MRDHEQEYPKHQPGRGEHQHHDPFAIQEEGELEERGPIHQRKAATTPQLPHGHARKSLIIGTILGLLASAQGIILTLKNADVYKEAAKYTKDLPARIWGAEIGIFVLGLGISLLIYLIGGMVIGRVAVHRRWAFIGGFVGGFVSSLIGAVVKQIPGYPNVSNTGFSGDIAGMSAGLVTLLIASAVLGLVAGVVCLLGAWVTTRRHPYYVGYSG